MKGSGLEGSKRMAFSNWFMASSTSSFISKNSAYAATTSALLGAALFACHQHEEGPPNIII